MKHGSLFSGIGGFDLAAEWMGWENVFHCENNEFCQKVLKHHFPNSIQHGDITTTDFTKYRGLVDIVTGGFPCQPYSVAGKRKGNEDDRHLWPQMLRAVTEIQPAWVVGENVLGLLNWERGMVLAEIVTDLEVAGFEVFPPVILPACGKNAPHERGRLWVIAYSEINNASRGQPQHSEESDCERQWERLRNQSSGNGNTGVTADTNFQGLPEWVQSGKQQDENQNGTYKGSKYSRTYSKSEWREFPIESPIRGGNDGLPDRLVGITVSKHRTESIKAYGNSIVPQVAYEIFKAIESINN